MVNNGFFTDEHGFWTEQAIVFLVSTEYSEEHKFKVNKNGERKRASVLFRVNPWLIKIVVDKALSVENN